MRRWHHDASDSIFMSRVRASRRILELQRLLAYEKERRRDLENLLRLAANVKEHAATAGGGANELSEPGGERSR